MSNLSRLEAVSSLMDTAINKANNLPMAGGGSGDSSLSSVSIMSYTPGLKPIIYYTGADNSIQTYEFQGSIFEMAKLEVQMNTIITLSYGFGFSTESGLANFVLVNDPLMDLIITNAPLAELVIIDFDGFVEPDSKIHYLGEGMKYRSDEMYSGMTIYTIKNSILAIEYYGDSEFPGCTYIGGSSPYKIFMVSGSDESDMGSGDE